jgi:TonB family protein
MKKTFYLIFIAIVALYPQGDIVKTYFNNNKVESEITMVNGVREGVAKFYYENGTLKEEREYVNGRVEGLVKVYSESGKLKEVINIENGRREGPTSLFDDEGIYLTDVTYIEGRKFIEPERIFEEPVYSEVDIALVEEIKPASPPVRKKPANSMPLPPEQVEDNLADDPAYFKSVEIMPEPYGGWDNLFKRVRYPSEARKRKVEGIVKLRAFIDRNGDVNDVEILEDIGHGTGDAAKTAVYYARFKPGLQKGTAVKVQMEFTVPFKLN